jgi:hypothetical protein
MNAKQGSRSKVMNETLKINDCERGGELVAYFYGEASAAERESFDAHLARCAACRDELTAFAGVREAVGNWRAEILNNAPALSFADAVASPSSAREVRRESIAPQRRSARAAVREFFTLSPAWLRVSMTAAALVVCALVALAVVNAEVRWDNNGLAYGTRLRVETKTAPPTPEVAAPNGKVYTQAELDNLAAERDAALRELEDTRAQLEDSRAVNLISAVGTLEPVSASNTISTTNNVRRERRAAPAAPNARQRKFRDERDEEDVPRLYDLLREAN